MLIWMLIFWITFCRSNNVDFGKAMVHKPSMLTWFENRKCTVGKGKAFGAILTDLSKLFDFLDRHELLMTKLNTYGFSLPVIKNSS